MKLYRVISLIQPGLKQASCEATASSADDDDDDDDDDEEEEEDDMFVVFTKISSPIKWSIKE